MRYSSNGCLLYINAARSGYLQRWNQGIFRLTVRFPTTFNEAMWYLACRTSFESGTRYAIRLVRFPMECGTIQRFQIGSAPTLFARGLAEFLGSTIIK